ncbi:uncharacterized protein LOC130046337 isoform X2 [Ostrea edulis]|uniref:uncharacterized protein LOC130046337 isoform X2 n=1 Tax=Ostrea edulis TaxID=37623 RepID=UPI0024AF1EA5|nr:uncharacterized protein LOC130046337 isoform X2 [Ostrea edulis]XP_056020480.1 uncharacterized protein LOC130046337 isoform X2 [Ostrea edulis]
MLRVKWRARNAPYIGPAAGTRGAASRTTTAHASARPTTVTTHMATDLPTQPSLPVIPLNTPPVVDPHQQVMANFPINENRGEQISVGPLQIPCPTGREISVTDTSSNMASLEYRIEALLAAAVSKNTAATYSRALDSFTEFRSKYNLPSFWPPSVDQIVYYLAYLSTKNISFSTAKCYLSGLSYHLQIQGKEDTTKVFIVKKMLEGMHRLNPLKHIRAPISLPLLNRVTLALPSVCKNYYEATLFTVAFHLAFFALLRFSELTISTNTSYAISIHDLGFYKNQIKLRIRGSKTDQYAVGFIVQIDLNHETSTLF